MIRRSHKSRWYFLIQIFFYFYFAFCGNKILFSRENRKMTKIRKLLAKSYRTNTDIFPALRWEWQTASRERTIRVRWQTWTLVLCQVQAKSCQTETSQENTLYFLTNRRKISQTFFFFILKRIMPFICLLLRILP